MKLKATLPTLVLFISMLVAAPPASAAQSIIGWICDNSSWQITMNEAVTGTPIVRVNGSTLSSSIIKSNSNKTLTAPVSACGGTPSGLSVTIGSNTYSWSF